MSYTDTDRSRWNLRPLFLFSAFLGFVGLLLWADDVSAQWGSMPNTPECQEFKRLISGSCSSAMAMTGACNVARVQQLANACNASAARQPSSERSRQPDCPNGGSKVNGSCVPDGAVACSGGSFCPQGMMCKPGGGCSLKDDTATMIEDLKNRIEGDPAENRRKSEELERIKKELEAGYNPDDAALKQQQERVLGTADPKTAEGAEAVQGSPEMQRLHKALEDAKTDLTRIRDGLQTPGADPDAAVRRAQQEMRDSAALKELDAALPPAKQQLEGRLPPPASQNPAPAPAVQGQTSAPAASSTAPSPSLPEGASSSAPATSFPPRNTPPPQAAPAGTVSSGYPVNPTGDVSPSTGQQATTSAVQDWLAGRPVDPMKLPPDARRQYYEQKARQDIEAQSEAIRKEQAAERAHQETYGQVARDNAPPEPEPALVPDWSQKEWEAALGKLEGEAGSEAEEGFSIFGIRPKMPDWWTSQQKAGTQPIEPAPRQVKEYR